MDFQDLFRLAMKRDVPEIISMPEDGVILNLGAGNTSIPGTVPLDWPEWDANLDEIPYADGSVDGVHAYHFLEHVRRPIHVIREVQRVLRVGGIFNIGVPYYSSQLMHQDLSHRQTMFCEMTWDNLFHNKYYTEDRTGWRFRIGFNVVCGIVERNMILLTQLIKE